VGALRLPLDAERSVIESIRRYPEDHVVWKRELYTRPDGALQVYRDGLSEFLHRRLYRLLIDPNLKRQRLARSCDRFGCVNPYHWVITGPREKGARQACPHGHPYTDANTTASGHCATCAAARAALRAGGVTDAPALNAAKTHCPNNHEYTPGNTYVYVGAHGVHRKCRICNRQRAAARRSGLSPAA
jgi:hypothetical protein